MMSLSQRDCISLHCTQSGYYSYIAWQCYFLYTVCMQTKYGDLLHILSEHWLRLRLPSLWNNQACMCKHVQMYVWNLHNMKIVTICIISNNKQIIFVHVYISIADLAQIRRCGVVCVSLIVNVCVWCVSVYMWCVCVCVCARACVCDVWVCVHDVRVDTCDVRVCARVLWVRVRVCIIITIVVLKINSTWVRIIFLDTTLFWQHCKLAVIRELELWESSNYSVGNIPKLTVT